MQGGGEKKISFECPAEFIKAHQTTSNTLWLNYSVQVVTFLKQGNWFHKPEGAFTPTLFWLWKDRMQLGNRGELDVTWPDVLRLLFPLGCLKVPNPTKLKPVKQTDGQNSAVLQGSRENHDCNLGHLRLTVVVGSLFLFLTPTRQYCSSPPQLCFTYALECLETSLTFLNSSWSKLLPQKISTHLKWRLLT